MNIQFLDIGYDESVNEILQKGGKITSQFQQFSLLFWENLE